MNILTDILSLFKRKKFRNHVKPDDVLVIGISEEPEIEGIASPVPYKDVKLVKYKDFLASAECENINVPRLDSNAGVFKDTTTDPLTGDCFDNFRRLKSLSLNLTINENGDFIEFDNLAESNTASNVGGGAECFKQKVGEDLEFRTFTSVDGSVTITEDTDTIDLSSPVSTSGIWSRVDAAGTHTYYPLYSDALAASSIGETITLHTDYELSGGTSIQLANGININLNGFTLTYSNTNTSDAITDALSASPVEMTIYNGIVIRKDQTVTGTSADTLVLKVISQGKIRCEGVRFINEDGWGAFVNNGNLIGAKVKGSVGGIALGFTYAIRDCFGQGVTDSGIKTTGGPKVASVINCQASSSSSNAMDLLGTLVIDSLGICTNDASNAGVYLTACNSQNITGSSYGGCGVVVDGGNIVGCDGTTLSNTAPVFTYPMSGVVLLNVSSAQSVQGFTEGDTASRGLTAINTGLGIVSNYLHCSGSCENTNNIGGLIIANEDDNTNDNNMAFNNCSFLGDSIACELNVNPVVATSNITMLNSSFVAKQDAGVCIKSIGTSGNLDYANCSFKTGNNSLGTPLDAVVQTITNTPDTQGNMYV